MNVEIRAIKQIRTAKYNPRRISDQQLASLKASIERFGFVDPVIVNDRTGTLVGGHQRIKAAKDLGLKDVPVVSVNLDEGEEKALNVALNKISGEWDLELLRGVLDDVVAEGLDLSLTGFTEEEWSAMSGTPAGTAGLTDPDEVPEMPEQAETITQPGDLWLLGDHRLLCGDSTKAEDVARLMDGAKADACVTDPPYGIGADKTMHKQSGTKYGKAAAAKRHYADTDWDKLPSQNVINFAASFKASIIFGGNYFTLPPARCWLVWDKENGSNAFADCELAWTNLDQPVRIKRHMWNGMIRKNKEERTIHPTQKPAEVIAWCLQMTDGLVYDPFLGSGTTLIASEQLGRKCYGLEISPQYCDVIVRRWEQFTGRKATRGE